MGSETRARETDGPFAGYAEEEKPLASYGLLTAVYNAGLVAALVATAARRRDLRLGLDDVLLLGVGTHKLSRLLSKDKVTSFLRAPFTRYQGRGAPGEVEEEPRGRGLQRAVGELLVCPYCIGQWVAGAFVTGAILAPRPTRFVATLFTAVTIADFLQLAYKATEERV